MSAWFDFLKRNIWCGFQCIRHTKKTELLPCKIKGKSERFKYLKLASVTAHPSPRMGLRCGLRAFHISMKQKDANVVFKYGESEAKRR